MLRAFTFKGSLAFLKRSPGTHTNKDYQFYFHISKGHVDNRNLASFLFQTILSKKYAVVLWVAGNLLQKVI